MTTEGPHYGSEALAYNDAARWAEYCDSERRQGRWIKFFLSLGTACVLCFLL